MLWRGAAMIVKDIVLCKKLLLVSLVFLLGCGNKTKDDLFAEGQKLLG
jgi:hypothetical protein